MDADYSDTSMEKRDEASDDQQEIWSGKKSTGIMTLVFMCAIFDSAESHLPERVVFGVVSRNRHSEDLRQYKRRIWDDRAGRLLNEAELFESSIARLINKSMVYATLF
jgi:hypothetical protein